MERVKRKRYLAAVVLLLTVCAGARLESQDQTAAGPPYSLSARFSRIWHSKTSATLSVFDYQRPLLEGLTTLREEYGWKIDLEEPLGRGPNAGKKFESTYPERTSTFVTPGSVYEIGQNRKPALPRYSYFLPATLEASVLNKIVSDYNQAGFPDQYSVVVQADGSYAVVGTAMRGSDGTYHPVHPILDTPISISGAMARCRRLI